MFEVSRIFFRFPRRRSMNTIGIIDNNIIFVYGRYFFFAMIRTIVPLTINSFELQDSRHRHSLHTGQQQVAMAERLEDLNLPVTAITRIAKEVLPANIIVSKEAKTALARAASVFILYVSNQATTIATSRNKKTISAQDVLEALSQVDFDCLIEPLQQLLEGIHTLYCTT